MQFYFKAQSQHGHSKLQLAVELARIRSFFGDAPYQRRRKHLRGQRGISHQMHKKLHWCGQQTGRQVHYVAI